MQNYIFRDTDDKGEADYEICGADFERMIRICCQYASTLSVIILRENEMLEKRIRAFEIPRASNIPFVYTVYGRNFGVGEHFYRVCPELCEILLDCCKGVASYQGFRFVIDPVFYREDGSVFFFSNVYDGECQLTPRSGEDISEIVCKPGWSVK